MKYFSNEKVTEKITRIRDISGVCIYLVEGSNGCALIDTGVGFGDLYSYVMALSEKEPLVIITHGHVDHAMGAAGFMNAYISRKDEDLYRFHSSIDARKDYVMNSGISGGCPELVRGTSEEEWKGVKPWEEFNFLDVGDVFDLGDLHLEICPGAGHTLGCISILIPEERMLFLGDAANEFTFLFDIAGKQNCLSLAQYKKSMQDLKKASEGRYDRCLFFHGPGEGSVETVSSIISLVDEILEGKDDALPFSGMGREDLKLAKAIDFSQMCRADGGVGNLVYDPALK